MTTGAAATSRSARKIHRGGNAEQYHANKKYKEALAVAVEASAADAKGQTCYICLEAVHPRTGEGLVRGCACQGNQGFAHVSCLAEQAKILIAEADEKNLEKAVRELKANTPLEAIRDDIASDYGDVNKILLSCDLCKKKHDAIILHALGWACWKICASKSEERLRFVEDESDYIQVQTAMTNLMTCLKESGHAAEGTEVERAIQKTWRSGHFKVG